MSYMSGYVESLSILVEHGGDVDQQNRDGKTPQDIASGACVQLMVKLGKF